MGNPIPTNFLLLEREWIRTRGNLLLTNPSEGDRSGGGAEWKKNCGRKESKKRVGSRCAWTSRASSEVVHRDPAALSAAVAEIMSKKIELRSIFELFA